MEQSKIDPAAAPAAIVDRAALTAAMAKIKLVTEHRSTIPILANARLAAEAGELVLIGTDLDMEIRVRIGGEIDGRFDATVAVGLLADMCKKAPKSERVTITLGSTESLEEGANAVASYDTAAFQFGRGNYRLHALPSADFPAFPGFKGNPHKFAVPGSTFWNAIDAVFGAMSAEETRYYLNGVYLHRTDTALRATATDGHRLYCQDMLPPDGSEGIPGVILPRKAVEVVHKLLKGKAAPKSATIKLDDTYFAIAWDNVVIRSKLVDGSFPDYGRVLPTGNDKAAVVDAKQLTEAVGAVTVISSVRGRAVKLNFEKGTLTLSVANPDSGTASTSIDCDYDHDQMEIGFNTQYLLSMIGTACPSGGDFTFKLAEPGSPTLIVGEEFGWTGCLMPMRV